MAGQPPNTRACLPARPKPTAEAVPHTQDGQVPRRDTDTASQSECHGRASGVGKEGRQAMSGPSQGPSGGGRLVLHVSAGHRFSQAACRPDFIHTEAVFTATARGVPGRRSLLGAKWDGRTFRREAPRLSLGQDLAHAGPSAPLPPTSVCVPSGLVAASPAPPRRQGGHAGIGK